MKNKIIAVQEGLHEVAEMLKTSGYHVTTVDESNLPIDIIIYSSQNTDYLAHNTSGQIAIPANNEYVKMINYDEVGKDRLISSIEELE